MTGDHTSQSFTQLTFLLTLDFCRRLQKKNSHIKLVLPAMTIQETPSNVLPSTKIRNWIGSHGMEEKRAITFQWWFPCMVSFGTRSSTLLDPGVSASDMEGERCISLSCPKNLHPKRHTRNSKSPGQNLKFPTTQWIPWSLKLGLEAITGSTFWAMTAFQSKASKCTTLMETFTTITSSIFWLSLIPQMAANGILPASSSLRLYSPFWIGLNPFGSTMKSEAWIASLESPQPMLGPLCLNN